MQSRTHRSSYAHVQLTAESYTAGNLSGLTITEMKPVQIPLNRYLCSVTLRPELAFDSATIKVNL